MKKKLLFFSLFCCSFLHAQAPAWKGIVGGSFGFSHEESETKILDGTKFQDYSDYQVNFNPYIGFRINPKWVLGIRSGIYFTRYTSFNVIQKEEATSIFSSFSAGLYGRRYIGPEKPLQIFLEPSMSYYWRNLDDGSSFFFGRFYESIKEFNASVTPGISWSISNRFNLVARVGQLTYVNGKRRTDRHEDYLSYHYLNLRLNTTTFLFGAEIKL